MGSPAVSVVGDADTVMMAAIEAGAEDVESSDEGHIIWCADTDLNEVSNALEAELGDLGGRASVFVLPFPLPAAAAAASAKLRDAGFLPGDAIGAAAAA